LQTLHSMLEREVWKQLPMIPGGLPSIQRALTEPSGNALFSFDAADFGAWVANGNPWRMQAYGEDLHLLQCIIRNACPDRLRADDYCKWQALAHAKPMAGPLSFTCT
jgi:hypothetical protein